MSGLNTIAVAEETFYEMLRERKEMIEENKILRRALAEIRDEAMSLPEAVSMAERALYEL